MGGSTGRTKRKLIFTREFMIEIKCSTNDVNVKRKGFSRQSKIINDQLSNEV